MVRFFNFYSFLFVFIILGSLESTTLNEMKKYFEEAKNSQSAQSTKIQDLLIFKEKVFKYLGQILGENKLGSKEKISIL